MKSNEINKFLQDDNNSIKKSEIKAYDMLNSTINVLIKKFKASYRNFTYSSAWGQLLFVINGHLQNFYYYLQDVAVQSNFKTASRPASVFGLARLQGHNAFRGKSAVGELKFNLKPNVTTNMLSGDKVYIPNYLKMQNLDNGLFYFINLGKDFEIFNILSNSISFPIMEGTVESQFFTGSGEDLQTYEASTMQYQLIDNDFTIVSVNGKVYDIYESLYDIPYKKSGCLVKTGMTSGVDVIFGKNTNAEIPKLGEEIRIDYVITNGSVGNVFNEKTQFKFVDSGFNQMGDEVNLEDIFYIDVALLPDFGADSEQMELTKILAPNISRNFIIHDKRSIEYYFNKMNYFTAVKTFKKTIENINEYSIILIPKIFNRLVSGEDYFSIDVNKFLLTKLEKTRILNSIHESGNKSANITINVVDPKIKKYVMYVFLEIKKEVSNISTNSDTIKLKVKNLLSNYLLYNDRVNKIPHSDIVSLLDNMEEVDTVKIVYVSENGGGIDQYGNINLGDNEMALIRGGWKDSEGVEYVDSYDPQDVMGSVNIDITYV